MNVTLGLPVVRTSVDHGSGYDIAGRGIASEVSLLHAIKAAIELLRPLPVDLGKHSVRAL